MAFSLVLFTTPFAFIKRNYLRRFTDVLVTLIILFFQYRSIRDFCDSFISSHNLPLLHIFVWLGVAIVCGLGVFVLSKREEVSKILTAMVVALYLIPTGEVIAYHITSYDFQKINFSNDLFQKALQKKPNIYYIILDGYSRNDILENNFNFNNYSFTNHLKDLGFAIAEKAQANYPLTYLALSSSLSLDYIVKEGKSSNVGREPLYKIIQGDNVLVNYLKTSGYKYVHFENGLWEGSLCNSKNIDLCFGMINPLMNETSFAFLHSTPFAINKNTSFALDGLGKFIYFRNKKSVSALRQALQLVGDINEDVSRRPFFLFAHTQPPHPPSSYDSACNYKYPDEEPTDWEWDLPTYLKQITCVNREVTSLVEYILANDKTDPVIVIQADHGSLVQSLFFKKKMNDLSEEDIRERFSILNALLLPAECKKNIYPTLSPVNNFRIILACLQGVDPQLLPDDSFFATAEEYPEYGLIARLKKGLYEKE